MSARDLANRLRYGGHAPQSAELAWIHTADCELALGTAIPRSWTGRVLDGDWDVDVQPLGAVAKIRFCEDHWTAGTPWSETGAIEHMHRLIEARGRAVDGCQDRSDIVARYRRLDRIFQQVEGDRRLMAHCERAPGAFREVDGIYMHFDRRGRPIFGLGGCHRLAIARIVGLEEIPVQVGVVHRQAIDRWEATARRGSRSIGRREWA